LAKAGIFVRSIAALIALGASANAAPAPLFASLRVTVEGVTQAGGTMRVGVYDEATFPALPDTPLFKRDAKAAGSAVVTFDRLPPGTYAVKVLQDINNDGQWEIGEPFGVSNGAARDNYDKAAIVLQPGVNMVTVRLQ
jgi:uncharacterized protein (DUF2141 family)